MSEGCHRGEGALQDRRSWRLLLARLHPDAGGDHELFLFACALMESVCGRPGGRTSGPAPQDHSLSTWRGGMDSWAARNREWLRRPATPRRHR